MEILDLIIDGFMFLGLCVGVFSAIAFYTIISYILYQKVYDGITRHRTTRLFFLFSLGIVFVVFMHSFGRV